jgi:GNAT superfamily N-acetyltransferase
VPELEHTVRKLYINKRKTDCPKENDAPVRAAAILYMFVEPEFRGRNIGQQALQIIAYLHRMAGCNYTILIADDKENGRLVRWYERHGYTIAPDLEEMMGTAQGTLGVPMIAPVHHDDELPDGVLLEWW